MSADEVWAQLETDPAFTDAVEAGLADLEAGRTVAWADVWKGPTLEEWLHRINDGACRIFSEGAGGHWPLPWIER